MKSTVFLATIILLALSNAARRDRPRRNRKNDDNDNGGDSGDAGDSGYGGDDDSIYGKDDDSIYGGDKPDHYVKYSTHPKCPEGVIQGFFGDPHALPAGFQLCDGTKGTPDLRDRFLVGAGHDFYFGDKGGATEVTLEAANVPTHAHSAGDLETEEAGLHKHAFYAETHEGGHVHKDIDLEIAKAGEHKHEIDVETDQEGEHVHKFDAFFPADYDTYKDDADFDVVLQKIDTKKNYAITTDENGEHRHGIHADTEAAGLHDHDIDGTVGSDHDGEHVHKVEGNTNKEGLHVHEIKGETGEVGEGKPFHILNPFYTIYWICCPVEEKKPDWYRR